MNDSDTTNQETTMTTTINCTVCDGYGYKRAARSGGQAALRNTCDTCNGVGLVSKFIAAQALAITPICSPETVADRVAEDWFHKEADDDLRAVVVRHVRGYLVDSLLMARSIALNCEPSKLADAFDELIDNASEEQPS